MTQSLRRPALVRAMKTAGDVIVDLSELGFADSSLMLDLAALASRVRSNGGALCLNRPQPQIRALIELAGLHRLHGVRLQVAAPAAA